MACKKLLLSEKSHKAFTAGPTFSHKFYLTPLHTEIIHHDTVISVIIRQLFSKAYGFRRVWWGYVKSYYQMYDSFTDHNAFTLTRTDLFEMQVINYRWWSPCELTADSLHDEVTWKQT